MFRRHSRILAGLLIVSDSVATSLAFFISYYLRFHSGLIPPPPVVPPLTQYVRILPFVLLLFIVIFTLNGFYKPRRSRSRIDEFFSIFVATSLAGLLIFLGLLYYRVYHAPEVAPEWEFSRITLAVFLVINIFFVAAGRLILRQIMEALRRRGFNLRQILIVGAGDLGRAVVDKIIAHEEFGLRVVGFLDDDPVKRNIIYQGARVIGRLRDLDRVLAEEAVDILFVALPSGAYKQILSMVDVANKHCLDVRVVPDLLQFFTLKATVREFDGLPIINLDQTPLSGLRKVLKRAFDIVLSLIGLVITAVLLPFIALGIKLSSRGPILYKQSRTGLDGKPFTLYKFRTMRTDAESNGPVWASNDDPRATKLGQFMRRTSLDELPQFWNVLKGDMSLVGPRPERPEFVEDFRERMPKYMLRHKVKAGMTGWAQVNGWRGDTSIDKRIEYDLYYIQNWSLALDLKIIWLTLSKSIFGRSPY